MSKERYDDALNILAYYHSGGDTQNRTVQFEFHEIKETIDMEFQSKKQGSYLDFFKTSGNRYRLMLLISLGIISQYSGNALFSNYSNLIYENAGITDQQQKIGLNAGQNMLKLFVAVGCAFTVDKVGRRPLFLTATTGEYSGLGSEFPQRMGMLIVCRNVPYVHRLDHYRSSVREDA